MPSKMVGVESAALSASRMSNERSAGELRSRKLDKVVRASGNAPDPGTDLVRFRL